MSWKDKLALSTHISDQVDELITDNINSRIRDLVNNTILNSNLMIETDDNQISRREGTIVNYNEGDMHKLVEIVDFNQSIYQINSNPTSKVCLYGVTDVLEGNKYELNKLAYCRYDEVLLGELICVDSDNPCYAMKQKDPYLNSSTVGKVIHIFYEDCVYMCNGIKKTEGDYNLGNAKALSFDKRGPAVVSARRLPSNTRQSIGAKCAPKPKINKYVLVKFI